MPNKTIQITCALVAILAGYSRMYLGQHFPEDVLVGALLGLFFVANVYPFFKNKMTA